MRLGRSASAKPRRYCVNLTAGSGGGCVPSPGSNGSVEPLVLQSCDAAASAGIWRHKPPAAHMALGGSRTVPRLPSLCQTPSSPHSGWLPSRTSDMHNPPNRRTRTRMSWWCGRGGVARRPPIPIPMVRRGAVSDARYHPHDVRFHRELRPRLLSSTTRPVRKPFARTAAPS